MTTPVAVFDFDCTLTTQDSIVPYLLFCRKKGLCTWGHLMHCIVAYLVQRIDPTKTVHAKDISLSFLKGKTKAELDYLARDFYQQVMKHRLLPHGIDEINRLRSEGYTILIVSASADVYMRQFAKLLPVDDILCTRALYDADDRYTGRIEKNCRSEEKVRRIQAWMEKHPETSVAAAYGDSTGDIPMLKLAAAKTLVDPSSKVSSCIPDARIVHWRRKGG